MSFSNVRSALVVLLIAVGLLVGGCSGGGGNAITPTDAPVAVNTQPGETPVPTPNPEPSPTTGSLQLEIDTTQAVVQRSERIVFYLSDTAGNYTGDPWEQGFNPNKVMYGPVDLYTMTPQILTNVPPGHYAAEAWLITANGYRIGRYVWPSSVNIVAGETTVLSNINWYDDSGQSVSMPIRPTTWQHNGQQPQFDGLAENRWDISSTDPLICSASDVQPSVVLVDRLSNTLYWVNRYGNPTGAQVTNPTDFGAFTSAITTMGVWGQSPIYVGNDDRGIYPHGRGIPSMDPFDGIDIIALDGAADRIFCLYRTTVPGEYRIRVISVGNGRIESDFGLASSTIVPTCIEAEPSTDKVWVGTRQGGLYCFRRNGDWPYQVSFSSVDQGRGISSLAMTDDRFLAVALPGCDEVRFVDTKFETLMTSSIRIPGVSQIASVENDTHLAAVARYSTGETMLQWHKRIQLP